MWNFSFWSRGRYLSAAPPGSRHARLFQLGASKCKDASTNHSKFLTAYVMSTSIRFRIATCFTLYRCTGDCSLSVHMVQQRVSQTHNILLSACLLHLVLSSSSEPLRSRCPTVKIPCGAKNGRQKSTKSQWISRCIVIRVCGIPLA